MRSHSVLLASTHEDPGLRIQRGLTMIEMLVSLVILGFIVVIMSGAFSQVAQIVRIAENANGQFQPQWVRSHALPDMIGNLVMPEDVERPFEGDGSGFYGFSLSLPQSDWGNVQAFHVKLEENDQHGMNLNVAIGDEKPIAVTSWDGSVEFEYLTVDGVAHPAWPPLGDNADALPSGVVVRGRSGEMLKYMIATYAGPRKLEPNTKAATEKLFGVNAK